MKIFYILFATIVLLGCTGTQTNSTKDPNDEDQKISGHTSQNSLDWEGTYRGILPCEDCEGIEATVMLSKDLTFKQEYRHIGKSDAPQESAGTFSWNKNGNGVTLVTGGGDNIEYSVGENSLAQLDAQGNKVGGNDAARHILTKANYDILEKYWKLVELNGKKVTTDSTFRKEAHIIFKESDSRVTGSGGCNHISGSYKVESLNRITISKVISTKMACPGMNLEDEFLKVLNTVDNFNVVGDTLILNKARMAPLARFNAVYMK